MAGEGPDAGETRVGVSEEETPRGLRAEIVTLSRLLLRFRLLSVPLYQRPFSWTVAEVNQLIQDLRDAIARDAAYYFMGQIVLVGDEGEDDAEIVDGQQRLVTLSILLAYLRDREDAAGADLQPLIALRAPEGVWEGRLQMRRSDADFFADYVQRPGQVTALAQLRGFKLESHALLAEAAEAIKDALDELTAQEAAEFARFLGGKLVFSLMESYDREGAAVIFRVLNDRGRELSDSSIIKAELLQSSGLSEGASEEAAERWDKLEDQLGRGPFLALLDLMPLIIAGKGEESPKDPSVYRRELLERVEPVAFLRDDVPRYAAAMEAVSRRTVEAGPHTEEVRRRLRCLSLLRDKTWMAPAVAYLADHATEPDQVHRFFAQLERLAFACFLGIVRPHRRYERFAAVVRARGNEEALFGRNGALELTLSERRQIIARINDPFRKDHNRRRVLALRLNAALGEALDLRDDATVEHVLPANPSGDWLRLFPDAEQRELLANLIGNWALITGAQNHLADDKLFPAKKEIYFGTPRAPMRQLTLDIKDVQEWTPAVIRGRQEELVKRLCIDWGLHRPASTATPDLDPIQRAQRRA